MNLNPIEGIDYIFDRYAYLNIAIDASQDEIHKTVRQARAKVHSDRMNNVHADIAAKADSIRVLVDDCAAILEDETLRPLYTERLLHFRLNKPYLVSESGMPMIDPRAERTNLESLLLGDASDFDDMKKRIEQICGYSPKEVAAAKKLYTVEVSEENRDFLESALTKKFICFSLLEDAAWAAAGFQNLKKSPKGLLLYAEDYAEQVEDEIKTRHAMLADAVAQRNDVLRIGISSAAPLLLSHHATMSVESGPAQTLSPATLEEITKRAQEKFSERAMLIRDVAAEKQKTLTELVNVTYIEDLGIPILKDKPYGLHLVKMDENELEVMCSFQVGPDTTMIEFTHANEAVQTQGMRKNDLEALGIPGCLIRHNRQITDVTLPIIYAAHRYFQQLEKMQPARPDPDGIPVLIKRDNLNL